MFRSPVRRVNGRTVASRAAIALTLAAATFALATPAQSAQAATPAQPAHSAQSATPVQAGSGRPQGPCDIYAAAGTPCVAAHSTTRALYASYNGPLYQVRRLSDSHVKNIGVVG